MANSDIKKIILDEWGRPRTLELYSDALDKRAPVIPEYPKSRFPAEGAGTLQPQGGVGGYGTPTLETLQEIAKGIPNSQAVPAENTWWDRMKAKYSSPLNRAGASRLFGTIAQALTAAYPKSWQYQLGGAANKMGAATQQRAIAEGKNLEGIAGFGITPEERSQMVKEALSEREATSMADYRKKYTDYLLGMLEKTPGAEQRMEEIEAKKTPPAPVKWQRQTFPSNGQNVTVAFNPVTLERVPIATSPIQNTAAETSLSNTQRGWYNDATRQATKELSMLGYGDLIKLSDGSYTIKYNEETANDPDLQTKANADYYRLLRKYLSRYADLKRLPRSFAEALAPEQAPEVIDLTE